MSAAERQSGWQLAEQVWQDAGVNWEAAPAGFPAQADPYTADPYAPAAFAAPFATDPSVRDPFGPGQHEAIQYGSDQYGVGHYAPDEDDAAQDDAAQDDAGQDDAGHDGAEQDGPDQYGPGADEPVRSGTGRSGSLQYEPGYQGTDWHGPNLYEAGARSREQQYAAAPYRPGPDEFAAYESSVNDTAQPDERQPRAPRAPSFTPVAFAGPRSFGTVPLGAPVAPAAPAPPPAAPQAEPDELFRAWQGSVRAAAAGPAPWSGRRPPAGGRPAASGRRAVPPRRGPATGHRGRGWQVVKVGVPAAVIVTVGAGALLMLTGRANEMLAVRSDTGAVSSASARVSASLSPALAALAGYPGGPGTVSVAAMSSASGVTVAAGAADGHPALWRLGPSGSWSLVSAAVFGGLTGHLTSVAQGPQGWIAVGSVAVNGTPGPVAYDSADGLNWSPLPALASLAGPGAQLLGVAAGPGGYLVVGRQGTGGQTAAALWWSGDLTSWSNGGNSGNTGSFAASAVAAGDGFIAVGSENNCHTVWTSPDGQHWTAHDLAKPDGAHAATLRSVAAGAAGHIVAAGFATTNAGSVPLVVTSADGGAHLTQVVLNAPDGPATVTAVTAASTGFVAAGLSGPANAQRAVTWTSKDGLTWSAATPVTAAGASEISALSVTSSTSTGPVITGTAQQGAASALLTVPAP
jgi:hypothetical protein